MVASELNAQDSASDAKRRIPANGEVTLPPLGDFAGDLTHVGRLRLVWTLALPFVWIALYLLFATWRWWPLAVACLVCLSFVTYGSISHDLVHGNLGLRRRTNGFF